MKRFSRENLTGISSNTIKKKTTTNRRKHINFKIEITNKKDIDTFINFLDTDIQKRLKIDQKHFFDDNTCHLKHLNFILMEILLHRTLVIFYDNFEIDSSSQSTDEKENIKDDILYVPTQSYKRDLTVIKRQDILTRYQMMKNEEKLDEISKYIYLKYKSFGFINLNFLKRKIYEFL